MIYGYSGPHKQTSLQIINGKIFSLISAILGEYIFDDIFSFRSVYFHRNCMKNDVFIPPSQ